MKTFIFHGGKEQLTVRFDKDRKVSINYPPISNDQFMDTETAIETVGKAKLREKIAKYNFIKNNASDKVFEEYVIKEFTTGIWLGFKLVHRL